MWKPILFRISADSEIFITVSIGVAAYPETVQNVEKLVEKADLELCCKTYRKE